MSERFGIMFLVGCFGLLLIWTGESSRFVRSPAYVFVSFCRTWEARRDPEKLSVLDFNRVFADYKWSFETELAEGRRIAIEVGMSY